MPEEPSRQRRGSWPPRGVALSLLFSMGASLLVGLPLRAGGGGPGPESAAGWRLIPAGQEETRCGFEEQWAALEYQAAEDLRVGENLLVQQGDRWEFEDGWQAEDALWVLSGEPPPGEEPPERTELEVAEELQTAPSHWRFESRTGCVTTRD